jgi:hypothetical protein
MLRKERSAVKEKYLTEHLIASEVLRAKQAHAPTESPRDKMVISLTGTRFERKADGEIYEYKAPLWGCLGEYLAYIHYPDGRKERYFNI